MSHLLDQAADGTAAFASARMDAWHRLGTTTTDAMSAAEALRLAHLDGWNVRKVRLQTEAEIGPDGVNAPVAVPDRFATVRTSPWTGCTEVLGVVGGRYTPIQNEAHVELLDTLVDMSGAHFETAGALRGGREVFVSMKLPEHMLIGGTDRVDLYLAALNSHDGSSPFRFLVTPVRIVCANTQAAALRAANASFSVRHTSGARSAILEARAALGLTFAHRDAFAAEAERMIDQTMTEPAFRKIAEQLFPEPASDARGARERWNERIGDLEQLFTEAPTNAGIRGTRWAAYQAVTEYIDHVAPVVRAPRGNEPAVTRAARALAPKAVELKERAFALLSC